MNDHLTEEEIVTYLDTQYHDEQAMACVTRVIGHVMNCEVCRAQLALYQETADAIEAATTMPHDTEASCKNLFAKQ